MFLPMLFVDNIKQAQLVFVVLGVANSGIGIFHTLAVGGVFTASLKKLSKSCIYSVGGLIRYHYTKQRSGVHKHTIYRAHT